MDQNKFREMLKGKTIPLLVLDQKWHRLFAIYGKTEEISSLELELDEQLKEQGRLNQEVRDLKKVKGNLMDSIVSNMGGAEENVSETVEKKLSEDKRLMEETNERIEALEDRLLELPSQMRVTNYNLMIASMEFCYEKMRENAKEVKEIADWISQVRVDLKKNIIKKQNREINNKEIYSYMHDILGLQVIEAFDIQNDDFELTSPEEKKKDS